MLIVNEVVLGIGCKFEDIIIKKVPERRQLSSRYFRNFQQMAICEFGSGSICSLEILT